MGQTHVFYIVWAFIRNLHSILTAPVNKEEMMASSRLCFVIAQTTTGLTLPSLTAFLRTFIAYSQIEAIKTKSGVLFLRAIFTRAYQVIGQIRSSPQHHGQELAEVKMWEDTFASFMDAMSGYFCALLRLSADEDDATAGEASIFVGMAHVWDFLLLLTLHTSIQQKETLFLELKEPLEESMANPMHAQFRPAIHAFLQRLQKDHFYAQ